MVNFVRYNVEEWSILYQDGKMVVVGGSNLSDEYLASFFNVEERNNENCFLGKELRYENVAQSLNEINGYERELKHSQEFAQSLKEQAKALLFQASYVENYHTIEQILDSGEYIDNDSNIWRVIKQHDINVWRSAMFRKDSDLKTVDEMRKYIIENYMS